MYQAIPGSDDVRRMSDGATIPADPTNADRQAVDAWLAEGNRLLPPQSPPPQPASVLTVGRVSFLREAAKAGIITRDDALAAACTGTIPGSFEPFLASMSPDAAFDARLTWAAMGEVQRASPLLALVAAQAGIPDSVLDAVFRAAAES